MACCYQHQVITRTNVYISSTRSSGIHQMAKFRGNTKDIIHKNMFESFILELLPHLSGENELIVAKHLKVTGYYTPASMKLKGGYAGFTLSICLSVRLSVCGQNSVRCVSSTRLVRSISYLHILSSNFRRCVTYKVCFRMQKFEVLANSFNLYIWHCHLLTWDPIWLNSMGNHEAAGGILRTQMFYLF